MRTTLSEIHRFHCDGCDREVEYDALSGWFSIKTIIAAQEAFEDAFEKKLAGIDTPHGDFCSYACVAKWAQNGDILEVLDDDAQHGTSV